jgi:uncharacterized membrane protein YtjA (UPF0391 family)
LGGALVFNRLRRKQDRSKTITNRRSVDSVRHEKKFKPRTGGKIMLRWAAIFLVIAVIAALLGFTGIAGAATEIAKFLFFLFLAIFVIVLLIGLFAGRKIM